MFGNVLKMFGISIRVSAVDPRRKHAGMTIKKEYVVIFEIRKPNPLEADWGRFWKVFGILFRVSVLDPRWKHAGMTIKKERGHSFLSS